MKRLLGEMLLEDGVITEDQLKSALELQQEIRRKEGTLIGGILVRLGYVEPEVLIKYLNKQAMLEKDGRR